METQTARNWYWWLWLSPLATLLTLAWLMTLHPEGAINPLTILGSALPHLILLIPALKGKSAFVRWHGRQALLLAAARTVVPLAFVTAFGSEGLALLAVPILIVIWAIGTLRGQLQAARGFCDLMRWFGHADAQPALKRAE